MWTLAEVLKVMFLGHLTTMVSVVVIQGAGQVVVVVDEVVLPVIYHTQIVVRVGLHASIAASSVTRPEQRLQVQVAWLSRGSGRVSSTRSAATARGQWDRIPHAACGRAAAAPCGHLQRKARGSSSAANVPTRWRRRERLFSIQCGESPLAKI